MESPIPADGSTTTPASPTSRCNADWFIASAFTAEIALDAEKEALLEEMAFAFLAGGGTFGWKDWAALSPQSRGAFRAAGLRLRVETLAAALEVMETTEPEKEAVVADG